MDICIYVLKELLAENIIEYLPDLGVGKDFLNMIQNNHKGKRLI